MNDAEKDMHILALEKTVSSLNQKVGDLNVQVSAMYKLFLEVDPSDPEAGTKAKRIMDVVKAVERSNWAFKLLVRVFLGLAGLAAAYGTLKGIGK